MIKKAWELKEIAKNIFLVEFNNQYDLAMTFLRYQEYYESDNPKFKGKIWSLFEYMQWYANKHNGVFTYPKDWVGFNIPVNVITSVIIDIQDKNIHDETMIDIQDKIRKIKGLSPECYLIGVFKSKNAKVIDHEIAHGFYFSNPFYQQEMNSLYYKLSKESRKILNTEFKKMGYSKNVWVDEAQAYLSTGDKFLTTKERKPFRIMFNSYNLQLSHV